MQVRHRGRPERRRPGKLVRFLAEKGSAGVWSAQTAEFFRKTARRFAWWLSVRKKAPVRADPFDDVPGFDPKNDRVHARCNCPPADLVRLLDATRSAEGDYRGLTREDRYHLYLTAFASGFRAGELTVLTADHFDLSADPPTVTLSAAETKKEMPARNPLPPGWPANSGSTYLLAQPAWYGRGRGGRNRPT